MKRNMHTWHFHRRPPRLEGGEGEVLYVAMCCWIWCTGSRLLALNPWGRISLREFPSSKSSSRAQILACEIQHVYASYAVCGRRSSVGRDDVDGTGFTLLSTSSLASAIAESITAPHGFVASHCCR